MSKHMANSGKQVTNAQHHSILTHPRKGKTFWKDKYLKEIEANSDQRYFYLKAKFTVSRRVKLPMMFVLLCAMSQAKSHMPTVHPKLAKWDIVTTFLH